MRHRTGPDARALRNLKPDLRRVAGFSALSFVRLMNRGRPLCLGNSVLQSGPFINPSTGWRSNGERRRLCSYALRTVSLEAPSWQHPRRRCFRTLLAAKSGEPQTRLAPNERRNEMSTITVKDGASIYYKDWGKGQPIVFSHGWPLSADDWDGQMLSFGQRGYRVIAHDRRGHGRSTQTWDGNEMDTYADDLAVLFEKLDLKDAIMVGHSTGGGEVARYLGRHGTKRVAKAALIGAVPPLMLKTEANPGGLPIGVFDSIRAGVAG